MYLTKFQKEIVTKIAQDKIRTVRDFLLEFGLLKGTLNRKEEKIINGEKVIVGDGDFTLMGQHYKVEDKYYVYERLIDFKKVINLLIKSDLIELEKSEGIDLNYLVIDERPKEVIEIINFYLNKRIIFYNELQIFVKNFKTPQERNQMWQRWVPIFIAILTVIISAIINYFIYSNEREVTIKNSNAFKDTLYIKEVNSENQIIVDTIKAPKGNPK